MRFDPVNKNYNLIWPTDKIYKKAYEDVLYALEFYKSKYPQFQYVIETDLYGFKHVNLVGVIHADLKKCILYDHNMSNFTKLFLLWLLGGRPHGSFLQL